MLAKGYAYLHMRVLVSRLRESEIHYYLASKRGSEQTTRKDAVALDLPWLAERDISRNYKSIRMK